MADQPTPPGPDNPQQPGEPEPAAPRRRLVRSRDDRMVAGVCGGLAEYLGVDATLVRVLVVVGTVLGLGSLVLAYLIGWAVVPDAD